MNDLISLEHRCWSALSSDRKTAVDVLDSMLTRDAVMVFPGGIRIFGKGAILESLDSQPWTSYEISEAREIALTDASRLLVYRVPAHRPGSGLYKALVSSAYAYRQNRWKLAFHQQTPESSSLGRGGQS